MRLLSKLTANLRSSLPPPPESGAPPRVWIEGIEPTLDAGAFPVKRVLNDVVQVGADIFKDGHDLIAARVLYRMAGSGEFKHAPMRYEFDPDRWFASFCVDRIGLWEFTVEAWPDAFGTWLSDLKKRMAAGQDIRAELLEGARLVNRRADFLQSDVSLRLRGFAQRLVDEAAEVQGRVATAQSSELAELMLGPLEADEVLRVRPWFQIDVDRPPAAFAAWYELFPRSQGTAPGSHGTFKDTERRLSDIAGLGFDVIYLPPIHPIGETHRKGKNNTRVAEPGDVGSPWAIGGSKGGHTAVHPDLGTLEDFRRLVKRAEDLGMEIALDFALQCSPDHPWVKQHPDWFHVRVDGSIRYAENPPKKYEDIYPL
ncbi:MAG TPA: maltotransferase domain-containing protein, partial [Polyangiaceae bacterium]|nr:maltotransferase domain-containing protein [Polyangiaceae bacterium]